MPPVATAGTGPFATRKAVLKQAAKKWGVPYWVLYGIWGKETTWGTNVATSSAGAMGEFQFIPSTAAAYHYPMTNTPTGDQYAQQVDAFAHYVRDLLHQHGGNVDAAVHGYSGGNYGGAEVRAKSKGGPDPHANAPAPIAAIGDTANAIGGAVGDAAAVPGKFLSLLTNPQTWIRLVEIVGGMALLLMGLKSFTGGAIDPVGAVAGVAKRVPV